LPSGPAAMAGNVGERRKLAPGSAAGKSLGAGAITLDGPKLAPPLCEIAIRSTDCLNAVSVHTTYTVPSGPTPISEACRPPTALLLCACDNGIGPLQVCPPSVERANSICTPPKPCPLPCTWPNAKRDQLTYTLSRNGLSGCESAAIPGLSSKIAGALPLTLADVGYEHPPSVDFETNRSGRFPVLASGPLVAKGSATGRARR